MEPIKLTYHVEGGDLISAGEASSKMKMTLKKLDLPQETIRRAVLGVEPENAYAVEDSFNGVRSATRAGLSCIMVPDIKQPDEEMRELACCILPSLIEVKEYLRERLTEG